MSEVFPPAQAGPFVADVLGRPHEELRDLRLGGAYRWGSGTRVMTWTCTTRRGAREVVTVVGEEGPRLGVHLATTPDGTTVAGFESRDDPRLPGMAVVSSVRRLSQLLDVHVTGTRRHVHKPLSRSVHEVTTPYGRLWVKLLRPEVTPGVVDVHEAARRAVPGPEVVAADPALGLLALRHLTGRPLAALLRRGEGGLPAPEDVLGLVDGLAGVGVTRPLQRVSPFRRLDRRVVQLGGVLPALRGRAEDLAAALHEAEHTYAATGHPGEGVVHGDLHAGQLLVSGGTVTGLLDLDDVGIGPRRRDPARLLASVSLRTDRVGAAPGWGADLEGAARDRVPLAGLAPAVGAFVLSTAPGPARLRRHGWEREAERRVALAEGWHDALHTGVTPVGAAAHATT